MSTVGQIEKLTQARVVKLFISKMLQLAPKVRHSGKDAGAEDHAGTNTK